MTIRVPLADLTVQHARIASAVERAVARVLASGRFVLGPEVEAFERAAAQYLSTGHAIGVSSGSDALIVALTALGVGPGDEVVTTPFTFFATLGAIVRLGATPRFADVDPATLTLDFTHAAAAMSPRTRVVLPVHLFGSAAPVAELREAADRAGAAVVEDAAQAFGSRSGGHLLGTGGALGCYSFFPAKVLGALGDAGLVVTRDETLADRCRRIRQHGRAGDRHLEVGGNFRLDALQAAVLSEKLRSVDSWISARRAHAARYDAAFRDLGGVVPVGRSEGSNCAVYAMRVLEGRRDRLRQHLAARGVETAVYYQRPVYLEPALRQFGLRRGALPVSERAANEVLALPVYAEMSDEQQNHVVDSVRAFFG